MSRKNYRVLWDQLKAVVLYGGKKRYTPAELLGLMRNMELEQEEAAALGKGAREEEEGT